MAAWVNEMNKKSFLWNMLGSGIYAAATFLLTVVAKRLTGESAGAEFYMAFNTGNMLLTIGYFELRPFLSTDVKHEFTAGEYHSFRMLTCTAMVLAGFLVALIYFVFHKASTVGIHMIVILTIYKVFDAFSDTYEGEFQRRDRMDLSGKSMFIRVLLMLIFFTAVCFLTRNILLASLAMLPAAVLGILTTDIPWMKKMEQLTIRMNKERLGLLLKRTGFLFAGSMICMWIWNCTKYVVQWSLDDSATMIYSVIFMPTMVINLGSGFLFKPMLTTMSTQYLDREMRKFVRTVLLLCASVVGMTVCCIIGAAFLGIPVLSFVYDMELDSYKSHLLILLAGGGLNAMGIVLYYVLTVMRKTTMIFVGYMVTLIISFPLTILMVRQMNLSGAAWSYVILMGILCLIFAVMVWTETSKCRRSMK